ncbi:hypothetical protein [Corynebacterium tuberculostearicum]|uniref:hypothetical protein n=1 Tax=Corynebacterium tuberculostearicum TaxID=38304 RepID=UPI002649D8C8|nr:hypothetical protein [Corynebacterium tuberculostearicum]WKE60134.1 hypothetical protein KAH61_03095 [Corynebacterium tuberculostearicum]
MSSSKSPKTPPAIPKDAADDRVLDGDSSNHVTNRLECYGDAPAVAPKQAEPKNHTQYLEGLKFRFGKNLIGWCLGLVVLLSLIDFFWDGAEPRANALGPAIELLKLVTTTALGYVFAKAQFSEEKSEDN